MYTFDSQIDIGPNFCHNDEFYPDDVKNEPMLFNYDFYSAIKFATVYHAPITLAFLKCVEQNFEDDIDKLQDAVFDSRVHMLMKGWFPCIPGFHHDDVPRSGSNNQPDYIDPEYRSKHVLGLVNGEICPTQFALGEAEFSDVPEGVTVYKQWHKEVEAHCKVGNLQKVDAISNRLIYFNDRSWHQGTRAIAGGWRWFGRLSWDTNRRPTNETRRQVQVYLDAPMEGW